MNERSLNGVDWRIGRRKPEGWPVLRDGQVFLYCKTKERAGNVVRTKKSKAFKG